MGVVKWALRGLGLRRAGGAAGFGTYAVAGAAALMAFGALATDGAWADGRRGPPAATRVQAHAPLVVRNDRGGSLVARLRQIRGLRASGQQVQVTGRVCYSTCTMFLGLPQTCISPQTRFGFHAPDRPGRPLSDADFDYASRVIAEYYPAPLKRWYLQEGRYRKRGLYKISGANLIAMGVPRCPGTG